MPPVLDDGAMQVSYWSKRAAAKYGGREGGQSDLCTAADAIVASGDLGALLVLSRRECIRGGRGIRSTYYVRAVKEYPGCTWDAFHGTTLQALPKIVRDGELLAGAAEPKAIYGFKPCLQEKSLGYAPHTRLASGVFASASLQIKMEGQDAWNPPKKIRVDQWISARATPVKVFIDVLFAEAIALGEAFFP